MVGNATKRLEKNYDRLDSVLAAMEPRKKEKEI